ncbi:hypothetical protein D9M68_892700 [compost metagenome]
MPVVPELPRAARKPSEAGARAFVGYYWALVNYAQATGDVKALRAASGPRCDGCQAGVAAIRRHYRSGGKIVGGAATPVRVNLTELTTHKSGIYAYRARVTATHEPQVIVAPDGRRDSRTAGTDRWNLYLLWVDGQRWRLDVLESR